MMDWAAILKIALFLILMGGYIEFHEYVHKTNCEYAGGRTARLSFTKTLCSMPESDMEAQVHYFDVLNEIIASVFIPLFGFLMAVWILKDY